jgi:hypothetical protein
VSVTVAGLLLAQNRTTASLIAVILVVLGAL